MKLTMTIDVPDDFKKGSHSCRFFVGVENDKWCGIQLSTECNADNCPLEIQEEKRPRKMTESTLGRKYNAGTRLLRKL